MPIEPGDSWFSPKWIEVQPWRASAAGGRALDGRGGLALTDSNQTANAGSARRATGLDAYGHQDARASPPGPPIGDDGTPWYGTVHPLSIAYALLGLGLGPTDPERIDLAQEPLGFRCGRFSRPLRYSCRHSHFRPLQPPSRVGLHRRTERSPTARAPRLGGARTPGFGAALSPVTLSAPDHSTSELLRTLSRVASSKPTSWLSGPSDHLSHCSPHLGALAGGLGCFPLDDESSHPPSHSRRALPAFAVWLESVSAKPPRPSSALPPLAVPQEG